jgi:WD40 repeat protein/LysM repeat protein
VILYNRIDQSMIRINNPGYESQRINWGFNPSISANGRWVVFTSSEENRSRGQPKPCESFGRESECMGIFLYDRETGNIERIDRGYDGTAVNGESYNPKISADGRWITFWSSADNLVTPGSEACAGETGSSGRCSNLFIYNRDTNEIERVPIGRSRERQFTGEAPSISSDGSLLALTIYKDDWIASELGLSNNKEAVVYNVKEGEFSAVNISGDGSSGDGGSYAPSISWDEHYVAFVSEASNLVPEDTNGISDVFVQDLRTGMIERVSVSSGGEQGNNSRSETSIPWGPVVDISRDGRFVVFASGVNDLTNKPPSLCDHSQEDMCNSIYIHDRATGKTERVVSPQRDRYYLFPDISEDGQQVTFMEMAQDCSPKSVQQVCGEVWVYDRQLEWISAVSKGRFQYPKARMFNSQLREIPAVSADIAFSPDGETVATVFNAKDHTGMINLWELEQGAHKSFIPGKRDSAVTSLAFSPDGQYLAAGTQEGDVRIWRLSNQELGYDLDGQTGRVIKILFSPDTRRVAVGTQHSVWVWELRDKTFVRVAASELQGDGPADLDISPDTRWAALAMEDQTVWLQNIKTGKIVLRLENEGKMPISVTFAPDGKTLAVGSRDGRLHLWELAEGDQGNLEANYQKNLAHPDGVTKMVFSPDGQYLVSFSLEGILRIWSLPEGYILNTLPESQWDRVSSFTISPKGDLLATSSWTGPTRIFQGPSEVDKPRFFSRVESDEFSIPLAFPPESSLWEWRSEPVTLYRANSLLDFDLQAPVYLPPGLIFKGAYRVQTGDAAQIKYEYYEDPGSAPKGTLFVTQEPLPPVISDMPVGESAKVESVRVKDANAEFVEGDWVPEGNRSREDNGFGGLVSMKWDPGAVFLRLRFQAGMRLISIFYRQKEVKAGAFPYLNKADLVAIAQSLVSVNHSFQTAPITIPYTVQEGDTCTSIASRFGTSIEEIVRLNNLPSNCDLIYEGQALTVPLTRIRETLTETDLDCNGTRERVLLIPNPIPTGTATFLGVIVERLSQIGFYQEAWQYTIGETDLRLFTQPQIFGVNDCIRDLAINLLPRNAGFTQFQIYHWDGETMHNAVQPDLIETPAP